MKEAWQRLGKALGLSKALEDEAAAIEAIKALIAGKDEQIKGLEADAADGKAYRDNLVSDAVKFAALLGEIADDEKAKKDEEEFLKTLPIARLKAQRDKHETKAREKFPTHAVFKGKDQTDKDSKGKDAEDKSKTTTGKKDYSSPADNELFKTVGM